MNHWSGLIDRSPDAPRVWVYCCGGSTPCWNSKLVSVHDLPGERWEDVCRRFKCSSCGTVGRVDLRTHWADVVQGYGEMGKG